MHEVEATADVGGGVEDVTRYAVRQLTRVEGEGRLDLAVRDGVVTSAHLEIFEAPRYFERIVPGPFMLPLVEPLVMLAALLLWRTLPPTIRGRFRQGTEVFLLIPVVLVGAWIAFSLIRHHADRFMAAGLLDAAIPGLTSPDS